MTDKNHIIIIGSGPAGCSAALKLSRSGRKVLVIEKLPQTGGLSRTIQRGSAKYDIGPHRFFTKSEPVMDLWKSVDDNLLIDVKRLTRIMYRNRLLYYPLRPFNAMFGMGVSKSIHAVFDYFICQAKKHFKPKELISLEDWVTEQFGTILYKAFFKTYTEKVWGIHCSQIDASWAAQRIKGLNLMKACLNALTGHRTSNIKSLVNHFTYPRHGAGSIYEKMTDEICRLGNKVEYNNNVAALFHDSNNKIVEIKVVDNNNHSKNIPVDSCISTMPLTDLILKLSPLPPEKVITAANELKHRTHISVNLLMPENIFPDNWIYVHSPEVKVARIANYRNFSEQMCPDNHQTPISLEYFAFDGDEIDSQTDNMLIDMAISEAKSIGILNQKSPIDAFVVRNSKAYCVIERNYDKNCRIIRQYLSRFNNIQTIGRAGMFKYNNQDHSIMTGLLAADNILGADYNIWNVNISAEYHESGTAPDICENDRDESLTDSLST